MEMRLTIAEMIVGVFVFPRVTQWHQYHRIS